MSQPEEQKGEILTAQQQQQQQQKELELKQQKISSSMILDIEEAKRWYRAFNEYKESVIDSNPNFTAEINVRGQKKRLINRSGWRAIAQAFHLNDKILEKEIIQAPDGKVIGVSIRVLVWHEASGRSIESVGGASADEAGKGWQPTLHNLLAIAHTRAKNRGISDIVGSGEPSSDEFVESHEQQQVTMMMMTPEEIAAREKARDPNTWRKQAA